MQMTKMMSAFGGFHAPRFGKVEVRPFVGSGYPEYYDQSVEFFERSTANTPLRQVGVYVGDIFEGQIGHKFSKDFIVTGKPDIHRLDQLLKRYDDENARQKAKPKKEQDYSKRNAHGQSVLQFLYAKAGLPVPKISPKHFLGQPSIQVGYKDDTQSCTGNTNLALYRKKHGKDFKPYQPQR